MMVNTAFLDFPQKLSLSGEGAPLLSFLLCSWWSVKASPWLGHAALACRFGCTRVSAACSIRNGLWFSPCVHPCGSARLSELGLDTGLGWESGQMLSPRGEGLLGAGRAGLNGGDGWARPLKAYGSGLSCVCGPLLDGLLAIVEARVRS